MNTISEFLKRRPRQLILQAILEHLHTSNKLAPFIMLSFIHTIVSPIRRHHVLNNCMKNMMHMRPPRHFFSFCRTLYFREWLQIVIFFIWNNILVDLYMIYGIINWYKYLSFFTGGSRQYPLYSYVSWIP